MTIEANLSTDPTCAEKDKADLSPLMAMEARMNAQGFLIEVLFYQLFKDQGAGGVEAKAFFNKLRRVPALKPNDPFMADEAALPFVAAMDEHFRYVRDRVDQWLKLDEDKEPASSRNPQGGENEAQEGVGILPSDPDFDDVQNFMPDELEDLMDSQGLKEKIKGIFGHDE